MYQASQQTRAMTQVVRGAAGFSVMESLGALRAHIAAWVETGADYYKAANLYEELSMLSDAELRSRGFSRATLARDLCQACDRTTARH
jgi:hypothetical protein